jgi:hypothetical protein
VDHLISSIKRRTSSSIIGLATYTVESHSSGTMTVKRWSYQCQDTSRRNYKSTSKASPSNFKIVRTHPNPRNLALKHKPPSSPMTHQSLTKWASNAFKKCWNYLISCPCGGYDSFDGAQFHCCGTNKSHKKTMAQCIQSLDSLSSQADATVPFHASDMIMNIHSNALYLSKANARSRACEHFFMGWMPKDGDPI